MYDLNNEVPSEALADREYARNVGREHPDRAWILSDRDVWYPNPSYTGPAVPHPDSLEAELARELDRPADPDLQNLEKLIDLAAELLHLVAAGGSTNPMYFWSVTLAMEALRDGNKEKMQLFLRQAQTIGPETAAQRSRKAGA